VQFFVQKYKIGKAVTSVLSGTQSFRNHSNVQYLFEIKIVCKNVNVFTFTFDY